MAIRAEFIERMGVRPAILIQKISIFLKREKGKTHKRKEKSSVPEHLQLKQASNHKIIRNFIQHND